MNKLNYIQGVDGLRAAAVLAVLLFHLNPAMLPGGFSGVDIFFVISGYVVSASLLRHADSHFLQFAGSFYARRILRIFPALIVCLLFSSLAASLFIPASWLSQTNSKTALAALFGLGNFALIMFNDSYFSPRTDFNPFTHTWSLGVEEQFYLLFPVIFFVWMKYRSRGGLIGAADRHLLAVLLLLSLAYAAYATSITPDAAFYLLPARFWELAAGAFLLQLHWQGKMMPRSSLETNLYLAAGVLLIGAGFILSDKKAFPFPWAVLPVCGTVSLISGLLGHQTETKPFVKQLLESSVVVYIGKISYSLYLWHWPVYVLLRWTSGLQTAAEYCLAITCSLLFAICSYHFIEQPFRTAKIRSAYPAKQIIRAGLAAITAAFVFAGAIFAAQPLISLSVTKDRKTWYPNPWPEEKTDAEKIFTDRKIFAIGDSHAGAYSTMLQKFSDEHGAKIINMSAAGCGIANLLKPKIAKGKRCADVFDSYLDEIKETASEGDIVFFASLRMNRLCDQWEIFQKEEVIKSQQAENALQAYEAALVETEIIIKRLNALRLNVIIDAPKPIFASPAFRCSDWFNKDNPVCSAGFAMDRNFLIEHRQPVMNSLSSLSAQFPDLTVWDPFPILCDAGATCSAFDPQSGQPLFFDGDHLSAHGNRLLYPSFASLIRSIWIADQ
uniref:acyltransferase family protein n=1 Tax=Candidatus Electronema sp. TaxID=2698783 RepID=UPI004057C68E